MVGVCVFVEVRVGEGVSVDWGVEVEAGVKVGVCVGTADGEGVLVEVGFTVAVRVAVGEYESVNVGVKSIGGIVELHPPKIKAEMNRMAWRMDILKV